MNSIKAIQDELKELNSNLPLLKQQVFEVPTGYFENFAASVLTRIKASELSAEDELSSLSPLLAGISKKMPFEVPNNFFQDLNADLTAISADEELPAVLRLIDRETPYQVPYDYFENLPAAILKKLTKPQGKVISFNTKRIMRYAAAAVITGIIAIGSIVYFKGGNDAVTPATNPEKWVAKELKNVSTTELNEFINTADVSLSGSELANNSAVEVRKMLNDIPTSELEEFLEAVPADAETLTLN